MNCPHRPKYGGKIRTREAMQEALAEHERNCDYCAMDVAPLINKGSMHGTVVLNEEAVRQWINSGPLRTLKGTPFYEKELMEARDLLANDPRGLLSYVLSAENAASDLDNNRSRQRLRTQLRGRRRHNQLTHMNGFERGAGR